MFGGSLHNISLSRLGKEQYRKVDSTHTLLLRELLCYLWEKRSVVFLGEQETDEDVNTFCDTILMFLICEA